MARGGIGRFYNRFTPCIAPAVLENSSVMLWTAANANPDFEDLTISPTRALASSAGSHTVAVLRQRLSNSINRQPSSWVQTKTPAPLRLIPWPKASLLKATLCQAEQRANWRLYTHGKLSAALMLPLPLLGLPHRNSVDADKSL